MEYFPVQHPNSHLTKLQQRQKKGFSNLLQYSLKATKDQPQVIYIVLFPL